MVGRKMTKMIHFYSINFFNTPDFTENCAAFHCLYGTVHAVFHCCCAVLNVLNRVNENHHAWGCVLILLITLEVIFKWTICMISAVSVFFTM